MTPAEPIGAVILAAGQSQRMGRAKMILPWGETTVIGRVAAILQAAGVQEIVAVAGAEREAVAQALSELPVRVLHNPRYVEDSMTLSLQTGVRSLSAEVCAFLVVLGDQPQIDVEIVRRVIARHRSTGALLVAPSFQMRRGHPWLVARALWPDLMALSPVRTARDFLNLYSESISYVEVQSDSILRDLDTPEDYSREHGASDE